MNVKTLNVYVMNVNAMGAMIVANAQDILSEDDYPTKVELTIKICE